MIDNLRTKLNNAVSLDNLQHPDILKLSRELDKAVLVEQIKLNNESIFLKEKC